MGAQQFIIKKMLLFFLLPQWIHSSLYLLFELGIVNACESKNAFNCVITQFIITLRDKNWEFISLNTRFMGFDCELWSTLMVITKCRWGKVGRVGKKVFRDATWCASELDSKTKLWNSFHFCSFTYCFYLYNCLSDFSERTQRAKIFDTFFY